MGEPYIRCQDSHLFAWDAIYLKRIVLVNHFTKMNKNKQKGTGAETAITRYLNEKGIRARRNPPHGSLDKGDIELLDYPVIIESKNCKRMELSVWLDEASRERDNANASIGIVWHKRIRTTDPGKWYVTMSGEDLVKLLEKCSIL